MGGLAPGLGPVGGLSLPITRTHVAVALGGWVSRSLCPCDTRGLEMFVLDGANTRSPVGCGCESSTEVRCS